MFICDSGHDLFHAISFQGAALSQIEAVYLSLHLKGASVNTIGYGVPRVRIHIMQEKSGSNGVTRLAIKNGQIT